MLGQNTMNFIMHLLNALVATSCSHASEP